MSHLIKKVDTYCGLLSSLLLLIVLRLPNFFEPYWYDDEGIYLTIGTALRHGARLYTDIIDHKTPLIYYLAMVPNQMWFRILNLGWMIGTTIAFYYLALALLTHRKATLIATLWFVVFTSVPWFEGNIPNGELFVMGFIVLGGALLTRTTLFASFMQPDFATTKKTTLAKATALDIQMYLTAGLLFGLGILTKVPALFDGAAFFALNWFVVARSFLANKRFNKQHVTHVIQLFKPSLFMGITLVGSIIASIIYFMARGSGQAYLDYGLLYNFRYIQSWDVPTTHPLVTMLFTFPAKAIIAGSLLLALTAGYKKISPATQFISGWFVLALFATLLSNRPYPHYFMQLVPAFSLLIGVSALAFLQELKQSTRSFVGWLPVGISVFLIALATLANITVDAKVYPAARYYQDSISLLMGQISKAEYDQRFNPLMPDNYDAARIISQNDDPYLFIWGTNPILYALTQKIPPGRFTVAFHIHDFKAYEETMTAVYEKQPHFIVVMDDETTELPGLQSYLDEHYISNNDFTHFELWKRR
jgi:hypothetical protein